MYLLDTDTLSNLLSKRPSTKLLRRLSRVPQSQQFTSTITVGELYYGVYKSPRAQEFKEKLERMVWPRVRVVGFDRKAAEVYGRVRAELERAGRPLADADLMIAAIGLTHNLVVVTGNVKHFKRVKGLKVENWL
jgi:predicted nucleic acid-binding protein